MTKVMVVRWGIEWTIWSVAPVSKIQPLDAKAGLSTILAEKMECLESMLEGVEGEMVTCEIVNEMGSSTTRLKLSTRIHHSRFISRRSLIAELIQSVIDWDFINLRSCAHWACVIGHWEGWSPIIHHWDQRSKWCAWRTTIGGRIGRRRWSVNIVSYKYKHTYNLEQLENWLTLLKEPWTSKSELRAGPLSKMIIPFEAQKSVEHCLEKTYLTN